MCLPHGDEEVRSNEAPPFDETEEKIEETLIHTNGSAN